MSERNMPLFVVGDLEHGVLSINIGLNVILHGTMLQNFWPSEFVVTEADQSKFMEALVRYLQKESEDGTTVLHKAFDAAVLDMLESGEDCFTEFPLDHDGANLENELMRLRGDIAKSDDKAREDIHPPVNPKLIEVDGLTLFSCAATYESTPEQEDREAVEAVYAKWGVTHAEVCDELKARGAIT